MRPAHYKRRGFKEITYSILKAAFDGSRKTRVMYASCLNLGRLNSYLAELISHGLVGYSPETKLYHTTAKGRQYMKAYERYSETMGQLTQTEGILEQICDGRKISLPRPLEAALQSTGS